MTIEVHVFDSDWYLKKYPDVAAAGVDPLQHYLTFGQKEGRLPCALPALELEQALWQAAEPGPYLAQLLQLFNEQQPLHRALAAWALARWYASLGQYLQVLPLLQPLLDDEVALTIIAHQGPFLLAFSTYLNCQQTAQAQAVLSHPRWLETDDKQLARSMLVAGADKLRLLNEIFARHNLTPLKLSTAADLDQLQAMTIKRPWYKLLLPAGAEPKVSVIMPCFNAGNTLATALNSLLTQSHHNLEILVADDCSTDNSAAIVQQFATRDNRVKLLRLAENSGAYVARNTALQQASGDFITTHDADDWSHPQKIAQQVAVLMQQPAAMATVSYWVRCSPALEFQRWRMEEGWIYRNVSSLLFRREVFNRLGFWDCVSVNADTEYYYRIKQQFGPASIVEVLPGVPLSFGRADEGSLSQTKASHLRTQFRGLRKDYHSAALAWQQQTTHLYLPANPSERPFAVPPVMCRGNAQLRAHNVQLWLEQQGLFDAAWYLRRYPDIAAAGVNPLQHFIAHGATEGRDPNPGFSLSGYAYANQLAPQEALMHWLNQSEPQRGPVYLEGQQLAADHAPCVMLVGHAVSERLFGAERSFLDVLKAISAGPFRILVALPAASCTAYVRAVQQYAAAVVVLPYGWWRQGRLSEPAVIQAFVEIINANNVQLLYANTLVLDEPLAAAREAAIPNVVHVRELLAHDPSLCEVMAASSDQVRQSLLERADYFIANSNVVAAWLNQPERTCVIPNMIDLSAWPACPLPAQATLQVAMLSSNLPKKGLADFIAVAQKCATLQLDVQFLLFGPDNAHIKRLQTAGLPENVRFCGYAEQPQQALAQADVVLNLSHFQESFGRSVLEAMAAGRVVVAYNWGALPELLTAECGVLVPYLDTDAVALAIARLANTPELRRQLADAAKARAALYSADHIGKTLIALLQKQCIQ